MPWIKRNLLVVISGAIALALLGLGGWYLWSAIQKNTQADADIGQAKSELDRLSNEKPFPSPSNVALAKRELDRMNSFVADARKQFPAKPAPAHLDNQSYRRLLESTVAELRQAAEAVGTKVETNYFFSFKAQSQQLLFPPASLQPLAERLRDVQEVCLLLLKSKINHLIGIRRAAVEGEITTTAPEDYLNEAPRTHADAGVVMLPYEFTFQCFSPELAAVMDGLQRTPEAWVIRSVVVQPAEEVKAPAPAAAATAAPAAPTRRGVAAAAAPARPTIQTVLEERALKVQLKVDVIKSVK